MVSGLVSQTSPTAIGRLALEGRAQTAAASICIGIGIMAQNKPIAIARDTECRLRCQRLGS